MNLPKRYNLTIEVKLVELPNQFAEPEEPPSDDPSKMLGQMMKQMTSAVPAIAGYHAQAGFDFRKAATVTVQSFQALAKIIEQYDELTRQIEAERP